MMVGVYWRGSNWNLVGRGRGGWGLRFLSGGEKHCEIILLFSIAGAGSLTILFDMQRWKDLLCPVLGVEIQTKVREDFTIMEKAQTRAFSCWKWPVPV